MTLTVAAVYMPATERAQSAVVIALVVAVVNVPAVTTWAAAGVQLRRLIHRPRAYRVFNIAAAILLVLSLYPVLMPAG